MEPSEAKLREAKLREAELSEAELSEAELRTALERGRTGSNWVESTARFFADGDLTYGHGTDNARDEAYWLVRAQQGWSEPAWTAPPDPGLIEGVIDLAQRRVRQRKPLAYLLGEAWFAGLRFRIDERVLVPRSPLAELIENRFAPWRRLQPGDRVRDVGTGSGCLAIAVAHHCDGVSVHATDISADALSVARRNVREHGMEERVRLIRTDLFDGEAGPYRIIMANPPYVPSGRLDELPAEYGHEPGIALDGGRSGLDVVDRLLEGATSRLAPDGLLVVEVGEAEQAFRSRYPRLPATWLEFERGGEGVFLLTRDELAGYLHA